MRNVLTWLFRPKTQEGDNLVALWRLRVWVGIATLFVMIFIATKLTFVYLLVFVALAYWLYALTRMLNARVRSIHIPTRQDIVERYREDPERDL